MKNIIKFTEDAPQSEPWVRVGTAFSAKSGKGFNIVIGNKRPVERGSDELKETVEELNLQPGDELFLGEATDREGKPVKTAKGAKVYRLMLKPRKEAVEEDVKSEDTEEKK